MTLRLLLFFFFISIISISCKKEIVKPTQVEDLSITTESRINEIVCISDSYFVAVGGVRYSNALLIETEDAGISWKHVLPANSPSIAIYDCVAYHNRLFAVGVASNIYTKLVTDTAWSVIDLPEEHVSKSIDFSTTDKGIIVGGSPFNFGIAVNIDTIGAVQKYDTSLGRELSCIRYNEGVAYASGYSRIIKSVNQGIDWTILDVDGDDFTWLCIKDNQEIWAVGKEGSIVSSKNNGDSWTFARKDSNFNNKKYRLNKIKFLNNQEGFIVGDKGLVLHTNDGGYQWQEVEAFTNVDLFALSFTPSGQVLIGGDTGKLFRLKL